MPSLSSLDGTAVRFLGYPTSEIAHTVVAMLQISLHERNDSELYYLSHFSQHDRNEEDHPQWPRLCLSERPPFELTQPSSLLTKHIP